MPKFVEKYLPVTELILSIIWNIEGSGEKTICKDVVTILKDKYGLDFAVTTVYTFLNNLVKKGYVKNENEGINFYISTKSKDEYIKSVLKRINKLFFNGNRGNLIKTIKSIDAGLLQ